MRPKTLRRLPVMLLLAGTSAAHAAPGDTAQPRTGPSNRAVADARRQQAQPRPRPAGAADPNAAPVPRDAGSLMQRNGGSLFRASMATAAVAPDPSQPALRDASFFAVPEPEPRTIKKHDLVTIIVREESAFSSKGTTDTSRESEIEARIEEFIKLKLSNVEIEGGAIGPTPPSIKMNSSRTFKGEGTVDRADSLTARITGEVLDVKPNGTLVVQARKQISTDEEQQTFILTGICRAEDVNADNTIFSTQMFDLQLQKSHTGAVRDATKRGWFLKLLDAVSPF